MKRLTLSLFAAAMAMMSWAAFVAPSDFRIVCTDGSSLCYLGLDTEITFNEDGTVLYVTNRHTGVYASYVVDDIEEIVFASEYCSEEEYGYVSSQVDVAMDPADDTLYEEVAEEIIKDNTHDDYGDFIENYTPTNRVVITYSGERATVSGTVSGVMSMGTGSHVVIYSTKKNIAYTLKGATANGSFKLYSDYKTQVTLDNVSITNLTGAAVNIQSGKTIMVDVKDGTTNAFEDGSTYTMTTGEDQKGAFFSEGQLVFTGTGSLNIKSNYGHGLVSDDYIRIREGNISISSARDGINTNDRFLMYKGNVNVQAEEDGVDVGKGYVELCGGKLTVQAGDEGVTASYEGEDDATVDPLVTPYVSIRGGLTKVTTTDDKGHGVRAMSTLSMTGGVVQVTTCGAGSKAVMAEGALFLCGGKLTAITEGGALYEADINELSSSAALRSKSVLTIENMTVGLKSTGDGAKAINNVGDVVVKNSRVTALAVGETSRSNGLDSRARGIATDGSLTVEASQLRVKAYDDAVHCVQSADFANSMVYVQSKAGVPVVAN